jgi:serine/threonine protein kinase
MCPYARSSLVAQFLHKLDIVHGDLKTLNALYVEASSSYKWCDFGFSKKIKTMQSLASAAATVAADTGTPFWMAPELFFSVTRTHVCCAPLILTLSLPQF